ncbi:MAG: PucR family transcriptional regulator [Mycobacterium sp.]|uniref:helix-turn-helix domain-containing protein n=1 Tax=Mycobacterium gordonae TaxID=1778 RepID=UPI000B263799|nr:helix-turn-helix domain-containing protein [Mycobacterium gordonae]PJE11292.1 MAG: PucR family transcriptional regulator [Mycobacterium sp.]
MTGNAAVDHVHRCVVAVASSLQQQVSQISLAICRALVAEIPDLCGTDRTFEMLDAGVATNLETIFQALMHDIPLDESTVPPVAVEYSRRLARDGVPVNTLVRAYRLGQRHMTETVFTELRTLQMEPTTQLAVIEAITGFVFEYVDWVSGHLVGAYEREHVQWQENQHTIRAMRVRDLLGDDADVAVDTASAAIDYPLHAQHLALIVWHEADDALAQLQRFVHGLAAAVNTSGQPLFAAADRTTAWVWLPFSVPPGEIAARVREYSATSPETLNIAMGAAGFGVQGFRRSHRQARRAQAAALARDQRPGAPSRVLVAATDRTVMATALLGAGIDEVRGWVADVLGDLACDTEDDAVLRETLRVFLHRGSTREAAARELNVGFNGLRCRVERAVARRGRPIDDRTDVELALFVCQWRGSAVLRPV